MSVIPLASHHQTIGATCVRSTSPAATTHLARHLNHRNRSLALPRHRAAVPGRPCFAHFAVSASGGCQPLISSASVFAWHALAPGRPMSPARVRQGLARPVCLACSPGPRSWPQPPGPCADHHTAASHAVPRSLIESSLCGTHIVSSIIAALRIAPRVCASVHAHNVTQLTCEHAKENR